MVVKLKFMMNMETECSLELTNNALENCEIITNIDENSTNHACNVHNDSNNLIDVNNVNMSRQENEEENYTNEEVLQEMERSEYNNDEVVLKPKRRKRHQVVKEDWESKRSKILHEKGQDYVGRKYVQGIQMQGGNILL